MHKPATQTVFGKGPADARVLFIGEQPGDVEDRKGEPFVGPAGKLLDRALAEAGIDRDQTYVTNAVKHFRFTQPGKRRLHQTPGPEHVAACKPWLDAELALVDPELVICLGATAAKAMFGPSFRITKQRGQLMPWEARPRSRGRGGPVGLDHGHGAPVGGVCGCRRRAARPRTTRWSPTSRSPPARSRRRERVPPTRLPSARLAVRRGAADPAKRDLGLTR